MFSTNQALAFIPEIILACLVTLRNLCDLGNTILLVEHDEETVLASDHVLDLGRCWRGKKRRRPCGFGDT